MDREIDKRNKLADEPFSYKVTKDKKVLIYFGNKLILTLKGSKSLDFLDNIEDADDQEIQLILAKATGNFKHGNERLAKNMQKNIL